MRVRVLLLGILSVVLILLSLPLWLATVVYVSSMVMNPDALSYLIGPCLLSAVLASALLALGIMNLPKKSSDQAGKNSPSS